MAKIKKKRNRYSKFDGVNSYLQYADAVNKTNEPSGTVTTYVPFASTSYALSLRRTVSNEIPVKVRNTRVWSDFNMTRPFLYLTHQDGGAVGKDVIGGLLGTNTAKTIIVE